MRDIIVFTVRKFNFCCNLFLATLILAVSVTCFAQGSNFALKQPQGIATDKIGNLFISDTANHRILQMDSTGKIAIIAGTGTPDFAGDGAAATHAALNFPKGLVVDGFGNLFIADSGNNRVRKVEAKTGIIITIAGTGNAKFSGDGGLATRAELNEPTSIALDKAGNLYVADTKNNRVRRIDSQTEIIKTVAGSGQDGGLSDESIGDLLKFAFGNPLGDDGKATEAILNEPSDVILDAADNLYIADAGHSRIRKVDAKSKRIRKVIATGNFVASAGGAVLKIEHGVLPLLSL